MNTPAPNSVVLDSSVLVNFLTIDRIDLLADLSGCPFVITAHVRGEITYPEQAERLVAALEGGHVTELPPGTHAELETFALLTTTLGVGESAAIAAAEHRSLMVAVEDRTARRKAESRIGKSNVLGTVELMVIIIKAGLLTVAQADAIKVEWETQYRFALPKLKSFGDIE